jgi:hypothetical protein
VLCWDCWRRTTQNDAARQRGRRRCCHLPTTSAVAKGVVNSGVYCSRWRTTRIGKHGDGRCPRAASASY